MTHSGTVLVTGAAQGVGLAIARAFAADGRAVVLSDIEEAYPRLRQESEALNRAGGQTVAVIADVTDQGSLDAACRVAGEFEPLSVVVANAGLGVALPFWELSEAEWNRSVDVTLSGAWRTAKAAAPYLMKREGSSIVFVGSTSGERANYGFASYVAAKHGLVGLMKSVALELAPYGTRSNAVLLGTVDTPGTNLMEQWRRVTGLSEPTREDYLRSIARMHALDGAAPMDADVVAKTVCWLSSEAACYITGAAIPVDAGRLVLPPLRDCTVAE